MLVVFSSGVWCDDPKNITNALAAHIKSKASGLPKYAYVGDITFGNIVMKDAYVGDLRTLRPVGSTWFWRKFIWFSVFGDVKLDNMYLAAKHMTIDGKNHTARLTIEENRIYFNWEAIDHFKCSILSERLDWYPLRKFYLHEAKVTTELYYSEVEVSSLQRSLASDDFLEQIRDVLLPCLHPKYPITYGWEERKDLG
ncbi:Hypothetical protein NTJ_04954 [Nesidiocoris tenuis]|uniref:Uncharacterized protein n=1 Tax=Nesidiocoris tenuis TaxID=355587 RepID=A0ABN7AMN0_9HEMI|nr:Hypothetical protein NTJ_04954 [Nesidiocoris tenuis]